MPRKICGLGFDCASMMLQPGIDPGFCLNYDTCGGAIELTPDEEIELICVRELENERIQECFRVTRRQAAVMMLMSRGCPQTPESLGVTAQKQEIAACVEQLHHQLNNLEGHYIAPPGCEVHHYNVKRPSGVYGYNKLTASEPIFEPSEKQERVRVIHLSHDYDPRNLQARLGIDRRNKLTRVRTLLAGAIELLQEAANTLSDESLVQSNSLLMTVDSTLSTHGVSELPSQSDRPITNEPNPSPNHLVEIADT
ncbi:hypothetical protein NOS3756_58090 (plasmid) [Nostoc sp. NIES-3756]|uniref:hypothetical protein n=1 Tax=Nostoc sp. NIES-3756 TaxID=1751286 RepID=UPI000721E627|nr:hypothetical protein [Nostoc sp. NIES-3756]BAT56797.1 hypothetical protein NOS3756_58090 [Nostoc sp. NIES-3756]